jgi:hypothetical protein
MDAGFTIARLPPVAGARTFALPLDNATCCFWAPQLPFTFPNCRPVPVRITGMSGDTLVAETDWFESSVRKGLQAQSNIRYWMQEGKLVGRNVVRYKTTGPDTLRVFTTEGTRQ